MKEKQRIDSASRIIQASASKLYQGFINPQSLIQWLPPDGMTGVVHRFEARPGGVIDFTLTIKDAEASGAGKTSENADHVRGHFVELLPDERIAQAFEFESQDPAFAGSMTMIWTLNPLGADRTEVQVRAENVPRGISKEDHEAGLTSTLENLARWAE